MVSTIALLIVMASAAWLVAVAFLMVLRPLYCLQLLSRMSAKLEASNWRLNLTEQGLRLLAGAAMIVRAPASKLPLLFEIAGWLLVLSSVLILAAPIRWHGAYGSWWVKRFTPFMVRLLSPVPAIMGVALAYAAM